MTEKNIICGVHALDAALEHHPESILALFCEKANQNPRVKALLNKAQEQGLTVQYISATKLDTLTGSHHHQGIAATVRAKKGMDEKALIALLASSNEPVVLLVLEGVQDPHNLGACLRNAEAFGAKAVIVPKDHCAPLNATVSKSACGALETLNVVQVSNLVRCLEALKAEGVWVIGTSDKAVDAIHSIALPKRCAIVMGSEGKGLKALTLKTCDNVVAIPLSGQVNSLNVSVATGVCLYEWVRQRHY